MNQTRIGISDNMASQSRDEVFDMMSLRITAYKPFVTLSNNPSFTSPREYSEANTDARNSGIALEYSTFYDGANDSVHPSAIPS